VLTSAEAPLMVLGVNLETPLMLLEVPEVELEHGRVPGEGA
jgi:hypothetical protein